MAVTKLWSVTERLGQVGLLRLAEVWSTIRAKEGMGGLVLEGTEAKISDR